MHPNIVDPNKRYIRHYRITYAGINYLKTIKQSHVDDLQTMQQIIYLSLVLIWKNTDRQKETEESNLISSTTFTELNILNFLYTIEERAYGKEIKNKLSAAYNGLWGPSDGVLYPVLSDLLVRIRAELVTNDRDINAALNIRREGCRMLFHPCTSDFTP